MLTPEIEKHKEAFLSEARGHVETMNRALVKLEKAPGNSKLLHEIFWATHTLKSIAAAMNYEHLSSLCHTMEDLLDGLKKKKIPLTKCSDLLFQCFDFLAASLKRLAKDEAEPDSSALVARLRALRIPGETQASIHGSQSTIPATEAPAGRPETESPVPALPAGGLEKIQAIEVKVERLDRLMNVSEELLVTKMRLDRIREGLENPELTATAEMLGRLVSELQYQVMQARMVPIGFAFERFPRMIRDLAKAERKEVELTVEGSEIELDRGVIDEIGESLAHLLRNAVDHGLETSEARRKAGKPAVGTIRLSAQRTKEAVVIEVADDGQGLDLEQIKATALKRGVIGPQATKDEIASSIFSGVSTTREVTAVSGRGLGLDIVKRKIESIGGSVEVTSTPGQGTTFRLQIPLTLAVIKTLFVEVGGKTYAVPVANVERLVTASPEEIKGMLNYEAIVLEKEDVPVTRLNSLFGLEAPALAQQPIVVVRKDEERLGLAVDNLLSTQEVVVKPLNPAVRENRYFSGAALIGSGEAILILDVAHLVLSRRRQNREKVS